MFFTRFGNSLHKVWGGGGGAPKGLVHNLLMQFFTLGSSKIEVFETCPFDMHGGGGGGSQGIGTQPADVFHPT